MLQESPLLYLSVIVPAYNEEERLLTTLHSILGQIPSVVGNQGWEVLIADDGSTDRTAEIANTVHRQEPRVSPLRLPHRGKGAAVRAGMLAARGERLLFTDADLATPFAEATKLIAALEAGADVAIGSRAAIGAQRLDEPFHRQAMGRIFHLAVRVLLMHDFTDTQCGFKAFRRPAARDIFQRLTLYNDDSPVLTYPAVTAFDVEVLYLAMLLGYTIHEVPVEWHYRTSSKVNPLRDSYSVIRDVLTVRNNARRRLYSTAPLENTYDHRESPIT